MYFKKIIHTQFEVCVFCCVLPPVNFNHILHGYVTGTGGNHLIAPVPVKLPWRIWVNASWKSTISSSYKLKQSTDTTESWAYTTSIIYGTCQQPLLGLIFLVHGHAVKSLQLIWRSGSSRFHLQWLDLKVRYQDNSASNDHQGDLPHSSYSAVCSPVHVYVPVYISCPAVPWAVCPVVWVHCQPPEWLWRYQIWKRLSNRQRLFPGNIHTLRKLHLFSSARSLGNSITYLQCLNCSHITKIAMDMQSWVS